jgi:hypothetical protein
MSTELTTHVDEPERRGQNNLMEVAASRQAQEVQAMIVIAKKFPRDVNTSISEITTACQRRGLAEVGMYQYPRGNETVTGPSVRLAEAMAQGWGNIEYGIRELSQGNGESVCEAYAWDMQTNVRSATTFTVKHMRHTKRGSYALTDPRDVSEMILNQGARRKRSCILAVIPKDVQDIAVEQCEKTLMDGHKEPLVDRIRKMLEAFKAFGVSAAMIEARMQRKTTAFTEQHMLALRKIYTSIKDNMACAEDYFEFLSTSSSEAGEPETPKETKAEKAAKDLKKEKKKEKGAEPEKTAESSEEPSLDEVPEALREYHWELFKTASVEAARAVWKTYVFEHKADMAADLYERACAYRDEHINFLPKDE